MSLPTLEQDSSAAVAFTGQLVAAYVARLLPPQRAAQVAGPMASGRAHAVDEAEHLCLFALLETTPRHRPVNDQRPVGLQGVGGPLHPAAAGEEAPLGGQQPFCVSPVVAGPWYAREAPVKLVVPVLPSLHFNNEIIVNQGDREAVLAEADALRPPTVAEACIWTADT